MTTLSGQPVDPQQLSERALAFHQSGSMAQAEQLYLQVLAVAPDHFTARHSLGVLRAEQGRITEAIELIGTALRTNPGSVSAWMNHGSVLCAAGYLEQALASYGQALALDPNHVEGLRNRGRTLRDLGRLQEALADFDALLAAAPDDLDARNDRADIYMRLNRPDAALADYDKSLAIAPDDVTLLNGRGNVLRVMKRFADALTSYDRALAIMPNLAETLNNRGVALAELRRPGEAVANYDRALALTPDIPEALNNRGFILNNRAKALCEQDRIAEGFVDFTRSADIIYNIATAPPPFTGPALPHKASHDREQREYLAAQASGKLPEDGRLHFEGGARLMTPAINHDLPASRIAEQWQTAAPKTLVIDNFLTETALAQLRRFCWGSTMWRVVYKDGYLGAFPEQGFACPLLAQIAEELRDFFPPIFQGHALRYLWAFKYDSQLSGTIVHADEAAVNVNFWITPDEANLDPESGGLVIWDKAAPPDWNFLEYNGEAAPIREFLARSGAKSITVPYRSNRAVIFDSDLFHQTDKPVFKRGYLNRRINITLLYGRRVTSVQK